MSGLDVRLQCLARNFSRTQISGNLSRIALVRIAVAAAPRCHDAQQRAFAQRNFRTRSRQLHDGGLIRIENKGATPAAFAALETLSRETLP